MAALSFVMLLGWIALRPVFAADPGIDDSDLPKCEYDTETQFYNVEIDVIDLPEDCADPDLINIGFIIQDVVDAVEARMPDFAEEYMATQVCPWPDYEDGRRNLRRASVKVILPEELHANQRHANDLRRLATPAPAPKKKKKRRFKFRGSGRCTRCKANNNARRLRKVGYSDNGRELWKRKRRKSKPKASSDSGSSSASSDSGSSQSSASSDSSSTPSFGIKDLILVDAETNNDIAVIGSQNCTPLSNCFGSCKIFNIRAEVFGNVRSVYLKSDGPVKEKGRKEGIAPYSVWGDDGRGNYKGMHLNKGTYRVSAQATDSRGTKSTLVTKTFTVESPRVATAQAAQVVALPAPTEAPTRTPTVTPTALPTASPTRNPTTSPTPLPSSNPTVSPTGSPTSSPTGSPTEPPTMSPTLSPTDSPTEAPTPLPSSNPTAAPSYSPTVSPTSGPTASPTVPPTVSPTRSPTDTPTEPPTPLPSSNPTMSPTFSPTVSPTAKATDSPTLSPTVSPTDSPTTSPTRLPTAGPTGSPTTTPTLVPSFYSAASIADISTVETFQPRSRQEEYMSRLSSNLATSNTNCSEVKQAMIQKTLAEETALVGDETYNDIMEMSREYVGNKDVDKIIADAELAIDRLRDEAMKACEAADRASELCISGDQRFMRRLQGDETMQEEVDTASAAVVESRLSLSEEKAAKDAMEEAIALIEFDPVMSELEVTLEEDEAILVDHLDTVEQEITKVDSEIQELPAGATEMDALQNKRDSLVQEEVQIEQVLANDEQFLISQSALKKDEYYESVAPDFEESPPLQYVQTSSTTEVNSSLLQYILRARTTENATETDANWDAEEETRGSKEEWFRRFGDLVVSDVQTRLFVAYNTDVGGCITPDSDISIVVIVTELGTIWEQFGVPMCSTEFLARPGRGPGGEPGEGDGTTTEAPVEMVSSFPSGSPSVSPSVAPSSEPSMRPSGAGSSAPTISSTSHPSSIPSASPSTVPSSLPTISLTDAPSTVPSDSPSVFPTTSSPSSSPSSLPTTTGSQSPTTSPSNSPSIQTSGSPSVEPSSDPTLAPSDMPSSEPSDSTSVFPTTSSPSNTPSSLPTVTGSQSPTESPSDLPSAQISASPSTAPSDAPSESPSLDPTDIPSASPTSSPTVSPTLGPMTSPTLSPTLVPISGSIGSGGIAIWAKNEANEPKMKAFDGGTWEVDVRRGPSSNYRFSNIEGASSPTGEKIVIGVTGQDSGSRQINAMELDNNEIRSSSNLVSSSSVDHDYNSANVGFETASGVAFMVWNNGSSRPKYSTKRHGGTWSNPSDVRLTNNQLFWVDIASNPNPTSNKIALAMSTASSGYVPVDFAEWDGSGNGSGSLDVSRNIGRTYRARSAVVAYEAVRGRALIVWGENDTTLRYSVWDGSRFTTSNAKVPGIIGSVKASFKSQPGTNNLLLGIMGRSNQYAFAWWNGSSWIVRSVADKSPNTVNFSVAVAFESLSGESIEVWARRINTYGPFDLYYQTRNADGSLATGPNTSGTIPNYSSPCASLDLVSDPNSDRIMLMTMNGRYGGDERTNDLDAILWDGSTWTVHEKLETNGLGEMNKNKPFTYLWD